MIDSTLPKTIFFDWNKTLCYSRFWEQLEDPLHPHHDDGKTVSKFLFQENQSLVDSWMRGGYSANDILNLVSSSTDIPFDLLETELKLSCENMRIVPGGVLSLIQELRALGVRCVIASDNMDMFRAFTIPSLKLDEYFDDFLLSNERGLLKFDVDREHRVIPFFDEYLQSNQLTYSDVLLFDDHVGDGYFAEVGFPIFQIKHEGELAEHLMGLLGKE